MGGRNGQILTRNASGKLSYLFNYIYLRDLKQFLNISISKKINNVFFSKIKLIGKYK